MNPKIMASVVLQWFTIIIYGVPSALMAIDQLSGAIHQPWWIWIVCAYGFMAVITASAARHYVERHAR